MIYLSILFLHASVNFQTIAAIIVAAIIVIIKTGNVFITPPATNSDCFLNII